MPNDPFGGTGPCLILFLKESTENSRDTDDTAVVPPSEAILSLQRVTFHYKHGLIPTGSRCSVPILVVRDEQGGWQGR